MVSTNAYLKGFFNTTAALGDKAISSDAYFEIEGFEDIGLLIKQFPFPETSSAGEIEVPMPLGAARWQPQQIKINQQGQVTFMETQKGHIARFLEDLNINKGGRFNAKVYEGDNVNYTRVARIVDCFLVMDNPDRDWENRSQILTVSGTLFMHYLGGDE